MRVNKLLGKNRYQRTHNESKRGEKYHRITEIQYTLKAGRAEYRSKELLMSER